MTVRFVYFLCVLRPTQEFFFIWKHHHYRWRAANFDLYSALVTFEQWGFFGAHTILHMMSQGASFHNDLRGPVTVMPVAEHFGVGLSLNIRFHALGLSWLGFEQWLIKVIFKLNWLWIITLRNYLILCMGVTMFLDDKN